MQKTTKAAPVRAAAKQAAAPAPAKRVPAKKAAPKKATAAPAAAAPAEDEGPPTVEFHGRTMAVRALSPPQLDVWHSLGKRLNRVTEVSLRADVKGSMELLTRLTTLVKACLVDDADREWIDDMYVTEELDHAKAAGIIPLALEAVREHEQRKRGGTAPAGRQQKARLAES